MMIRLAIIFSAAFCYNYTFDHANGVLFQENEPLWTFDADIPVRVNVLLDSPREKFRRALNADCGEDYLVEKKPQNFFGRNGTDFNETTEDCLLGFRTFDEVIRSFMGEDLTMSWNYERNSSDRAAFDRYRKNSPEDRLTYEEWQKKGRPIYQGEENLLPENRARRTRRAAFAGAAVVGGVAVAGSYVYTGVVDAKSRARDALLAAEIDIERRRIERLEEVVETVNDKLDEAIKQIRKAKRPIVSYGGLTIPNDAKAVERILEGADAEINQYFAEQSAAIGEDVVESILTLMNHRLPLNPVFLDTIKAQCIVYQTVAEEDAKEFCNAFAFHSTRWDTLLRFVGLGVTTWTREDGKVQGKDDLEIRHVIVSLTIRIPRMKLKARKFTAVNLGYFKEDGSRWMVDLSKHLVVMPSNEVLEMQPDACLRFTPSFACSTVSLTPSQCGDSLLLGNSTRYCQTMEIDNTKCGYFEDSNRAFVSMKQPGIAQWFHHHPSENVNKIDSFKRTKFAGALNCGPQILRISAMIPGTREIDSMMTYIKPIQVKMRTVQDDEIDEMNAKITKNLKTVKEMGNIMVEMNLTTLELLKRTAATESRNAAETAKQYLFKKFIAPIIGTLGTLGSILLIILAIYIIIKLNSRRRGRNQTSKEVAIERQFAEMNKIARSNRSTDTL